MQKKYLAHLYLFIGYAILSTSALASVIKTDDLIVQGSQCVGSDCTDGMNFEENTIVLKENNLHIRFQDTSVLDVLGQSWNLSANSARNEGKSYFQFELKSLVIDTVLLSDGTEPLYDCTVPVTSPDLPPIIGVIPFGEPLLTPQNPNGNFPLLLYECLTTASYTVKPIFSLGTAADNTVTLGFDSQAERGAVSIGNTGLLRNLKNVAAGIAGTDILIKQTIDDYLTLPARKIQADLLAAQLAVLDSQIGAIEAELAKRSSGGGSFSLYTILWLFIGGGLVSLIRHQKLSQYINT
jgi:hypothetical protein